MIFDFMYFRPLRFYPYTSCTTKRVLRIESNSRELDEVRRHLIYCFRRDSIHAYVDNKIVFELVDPYQKDAHIFVGFYDGVMTIGLGVTHDEHKGYHANEKGSCDPHESKEDLARNSRG